MPSDKKPVAFVLKPLTRLVNGATACVGLTVVGELLFNEHLGSEKEGLQYALPIPARGEGGVLAKHLLTMEKGKITGVTDAYRKQPYINRGEGENVTRLYVKKNGELGHDPWKEGNSGELKEMYAGVEKQATPHVDFSKAYSNPEIVWPDGKIRDIRITIKANKPATTEEYAARQQATMERRVSTALNNVSQEHLDAMLAGKLVTRLKAAGKSRDAILVALEGAELTPPANFDEVCPVCSVENASTMAVVGQA